MKKVSKPGDMFNAFQAKKSSFGKVKHKKKAKMTQAQDDAYDKKHGQKEGSAKDIAQDKREGIKDKKGKKNKMKKKSGLRPASAVVASEQNASHQYYKGKKKQKTKKKLDLVQGAKNTIGNIGKGIGQVAGLASGAIKRYGGAMLGQDLKNKENNDFHANSQRTIRDAHMSGRQVKVQNGEVVSYKKSKKSKMRCKQHSKMGCKMCGK